MRRLLALLSAVFLTLLLAGRAELAYESRRQQSQAFAQASGGFLLAESPAEARQVLLEQTSIFVTPAETASVNSAAARSLPVRVWRRAFAYTAPRIPARFSSVHQSGPSDRALLCYRGCAHSCCGADSPGDYYIYMLRRIVI